MKRFTLIELMIVVAIIAIIAAIAIPSLLRSRIAANETSAIGGLKQIVSYEASWRQTDADGNGQSDHWTLDVAGFRWVQDQGGNPLKYMDAAQAKADFAKQIKTATGQTDNPKSGYLYGAIVLDENGSSYNQNTRAGAQFTGAACNTYKFGFTAKPDQYGTTGVNTFVVNEEGQVYRRDNATATIAQYPAEDPSTLTITPPWGVVE